MQFYTEEDGPFNVVVVYLEPCMGARCEKSRTVSIGNTLVRAGQMVEGITKQISMGDSDATSGKKAIRAYLEPVTCRRPWTAEIQAAFGRERLRGNIADPVLDRERAKGELLHAQLCQLIGSKRADAVRDGKSC